MRRDTVDAEGAQDADQHAHIAGLVQRNADTVMVDLAEVQPLGPRGGQDARLADADLDRDGVEERLRGHPGPRRLQRAGQAVGQEMHPLGNRPQAVRPMENGIETGHHRQQRLRRADVRGGLFAADMLFASLQRQAVRLVSPRVDADPHDPAWHRAFQVVAAGHEGGMRAAITQGHAEPLRRSDGNIGPHGTRFLQQTQRQKVGRHHRNPLCRMQPGDGAGEVGDMAIGAGILENRAEIITCAHRLGVTHGDGDAKGGGAGLDHADGLGVAVAVDEEPARLRFRRPLGHRHRFRRRRRLVQQAGIGHIKAGQVADHGLVIQQRLKPALRNLGLIRGIGGVPRRILKDIPLDGGRRYSAVVALPDQAGHHPVLLGNRLHPRQQFVLGQGCPGQRRGLPDACRHRLGNQRVQGGHPHHRQHRLHLGG